VTQWLVCGGREFTDYDYLFENLDTLALAFGEPDRVIHGAARGADEMAGDWAKARHIPVVEVPADWEAHGKRAGYLRNEEMLGLLKRRDMVIAFPQGESPGTRMMVDIAKRSNKDLGVYEL
jgi:hypothetical protein